MEVAVAAEECTAVAVAARHLNRARLVGVEVKQHERERRRRLPQQPERLAPRPRDVHLVAAALEGVPQSRDRLGFPVDHQHRGDAGVDVDDFGVDRVAHLAAHEVPRRELRAALLPQ